MRLEKSARALLGVAGLATCIVTLGFHAPAAAQAYKNTQAQAAARAKSAQAARAQSAQAAPHLFGTTAIQIGGGRFAKEWARARQDASWHPALQQLVRPARHLDKEAQIAFVQKAVNQRIRWRSDATEWGVHDYWASAVQTLERGVGDMEDRAIVKLEALKLLGFPKRDLYLTLGRDLVGGPIAVLIVKAGNRSFVLDDLGGRPVPVERREGFTPQLSFGSDTAWAHATRAPRSTAVASVAAPR